MFAKIPAYCSFGELINYEPTQMSPQNVPNLHVQSMTVRILDEYGQAVESNNGFWSLSVSIQWAIDVGFAGSRIYPKFEKKKLLECLINLRTF